MIATGGIASRASASAMLCAVTTRCPALAQPLGQVVGEGAVVVDDQDGLAGPVAEAPDGLDQAHDVHGFGQDQ